MLNWVMGSWVFTFHGINNEKIIKIKEPMHKPMLTVCFEFTVMINIIL